MSQDKISNLYNAFIAEGYEMEPEEEFRRNLTVQAKRRAAYDALVAEGYEMEPFEEFETNIGFGSTSTPLPGTVTTDVPTFSEAELNADVTGNGEMEADSVDTDNSRADNSTTVLPGPLSAQAHTVPKANDYTTQTGRSFIDESYGKTGGEYGSFINEVIGMPESSTEVPEVREVVDNFREASRERMSQLERQNLPFTPEGRDQLKAARTTAQVMGAPTRLQGLVPKVVNDAGMDEPVAKDNSKGAPSEQSPVPYGVKMVDGRTVTEWLLPDGRLTTDRIEAEQAEYTARQERLRKSALEASIREVEQKKRQAIERALSEDDTRAKEVMSEIVNGNHYQNLAATPGFVQFGEAKRNAGVGDLETIAEAAFTHIDPNTYAVLAQGHEAYFAEHPEALEGKSVSEAVADAVRQEIYLDVHNEYVRRYKPTSKTEFFLRKVVSMNPASMQYYSLMGKGPVS